MATVFQLIEEGKIPSVRIYEDDVCFAILDISPVQKGHALVISRECYPTFTDAPSDVVSHMMDVARLIDRRQREVLKADGTNIMINNSPASGQEVPHLHIHVIPRFSGDGRTPQFIKTSYEDGEIAKYGDLLRISITHGAEPRGLADCRTLID
ncbi:MAG: HIT family protein [Candidatus Ornithospirochaeta sp.]|nr:HIT family protein [Candidatus Ornithospirochaeta sp.]